MRDASARFGVTRYAHGAYGEAVVTLLTVQNTRTVAAVEAVSYTHLTLPTKA